MFNFLNNVLSQLKNGFNTLSPKRKLFAFLVILATIGSLVGLVAWANRPHYQILYSGLSSEDAGAILDSLREQKIPYKIGPGGGSIMVPAEQIYEVRLAMAGKGLPQGGGVGYEIFDKQNLGMTEFVQKINFQRALQGELARTISQFAEIKRSRVHLTIPEKSFFIDEQEAPQASVVLNLQPGRTLKTDQIQGIVHLVASSVEGLDPANVTVVDDHGKMLAGSEENSSVGRITTSQQQIQADFERDLEKRIESMLSKVVGDGKIIARVSAVMNFRQIEQTEETYDPESAAVRSEQTTKETSSGKQPMPAGVPGVMSNTPDLQANASNQVKSNNFNKSNETINYEISRITKRVVEPVGTIKRINAAVMLDGTYQVTADKDGNKVRQYVPRAAEDMAKYLSLVKKTVGFDEERGDSVEVVNVQFQNLSPVEEQGSTIQEILQQPFWSALIRYVTFAFLFMMVLLLGLRPIIKWLMLRSEELPLTQSLSQGARVAELGSGYSAEEFSEPVVNRERLQEMAKKDPKQLAQMLKSYIK